jgi:hypothetical protein
MRSFSLLIVTELSLATVSCTIILLYVRYERSFDDFRPSDVYRIAYHRFEHNVETRLTANCLSTSVSDFKKFCFSKTLQFH